MIFEELDAYYEALRNSALIILAIGIVACGCAAALWASGHPIAVGAAIPLAAIGLLEIGGAGYVAAQSPSQHLEVAGKIATTPAGLDELSARLASDERAYRRWQKVEVGLALLALLLVLSGAAGRPHLLGAGIALLLQVAVMYLADHAALKRDAHLRRVIAAQSTSS